MPASGPDLVLANCDYVRHMTDEGDQLQLGLQAAGWTLAGAGYGDGCRDVAQLLDRHRPARVLVADKRDWDPADTGCYRKDIGFRNLETLAGRPDIFKVAVIKDAASVRPYHWRFAEEIQAHAILTYYHDASVLAAAPEWGPRPRIRTYHTVDRGLFPQLVFHWTRKRGLVSGAANAKVYPLRRRVVDGAATLGLDVLPHPGYGNTGSHTPRYLNILTHYRVHVATASRFGFALRKIIESVAAGATPVTDLPAVDVLPEIDGALVRIPPEATLAEVRAAVDGADSAWNWADRAAWAIKAWEWYDYRAMGRRLAADIQRADAARLVTA